MIVRICWRPGLGPLGSARGVAIGLAGAFLHWRVVVTAPDQGAGAVAGDVGFIRITPA